MAAGLCRFKDSLLVAPAPSRTQSGRAGRPGIEGTAVDVPTFVAKAGLDRFPGMTLEAVEAGPGDDKADVLGVDAAPAEVMAPIRRGGPLLF